MRSETAGALSVVTIEESGVGTGSPAANARDMASAPSVSTPHTRTCGASARNAVATPAISPPPPMLTSTSVTAGASVANSSPAVP